MTKLLAIVLFLSLYSVSSHHHHGHHEGLSEMFNDYDAFSTCTFGGVTHMRGLMSNDHVEACYHLGAKVLYDSPWLKISGHTNMNETNMTVDWWATKIYAEFYGDIYGLPIALFSSDLLVCDCTQKCLTNKTEVIHMGVDNAIEMIIRRDLQYNVAYLHYTRANITLFVRQTSQGFNFGIRVPQYNALKSSGLCSTGCPRLTDTTGKCLNGQHIQPAVDICKKVFSMETMLTADAEQLHIAPCARDIFMWSSAEAALSHVLSAVDEILITKFDSILDFYAINTQRPYLTYNYSQYDNVVSEMTQCDSTTVDDEHKKPTGRILSDKMLNDQQISIIDLSGPSDVLDHGDSQADVPLSATTIKIDLTNDRFVQLSKMEDNMTADMYGLRVQCERQRSTKLGNFYLPYAKNQTMFVQCDESNTPTLKQCPLGTMFTIRMVCENLVKSSATTPATNNKVNIDAPKLNDVLRSKMPVKIQGTTTPIPNNVDNIINPCSDATRAKNAFFFPHPLDPKKYVQCDDFNRMTIGQCMTGTVFNIDSGTCQKF
jgi:hypothetical protein